jgi:hypothetical protein
MEKNRKKFGKKFSKSNRYYKYYNKEGKSCRIKFFTDIKEEGENVILKYKECGAGDWHYHVPKKKFKNKEELIWYICKNLENDKICFQILKFD